MIIPHYINEHKSDLRGIKPGWYSMDSHGKLSSGPYSTLQECIARMTPHGEQFIGGDQLQVGW
jgi:hypothetical protein